MVLEITKRLVNYCVNDKKPFSVYYMVRSIEDMFNCTLSKIRFLLMSFALIQYRNH